MSLGKPIQMDGYCGKDYQNLHLLQFLEKLSRCPELSVEWETTPFDISTEIAAGLESGTATCLTVTA